MVLDTNVLIAALLSPFGAPAQILDLAIAGEVALLLDDRILAEYHEVARRPKFGFAEPELARVLKAITPVVRRFSRTIWGNDCVARYSSPVSET